MCNAQKAKGLTIESQLRRMCWMLLNAYRNCFVNKTTNKEIVKRNNDIALTLRRFQTVQIRQDNGRKKMAGTRQMLAASLPDKEAHICPDPGLTIITCLYNYCQYSVLINIIFMFEIKSQP